MTMLTSGSDVCAAATAEFGSSHPARSGAMAASSNAAYTDRVENAAIEAVALRFESGTSSAMFIAGRRNDSEPDVDQI